MGLQLQVHNKDKIRFILADGEEIILTYLHKENGNKVIDVRYPPIVRVYREAVYQRIKKEGGI